MQNMHKLGSPAEIISGLCSISDAHNAIVFAQTEAVKSSCCLTEEIEFWQMEQAKESKFQALWEAFWILPIDKYNLISEDLKEKLVQTDSGTKYFGDLFSENEEDVVEKFNLSIAEIFELKTLFSNLSLTFSTPLDDPDDSSYLIEREDCEAGVLMDYRFFEWNLLNTLLLAN